MDYHEDVCVYELYTRQEETLLIFKSPYGGGVAHFTTREELEQAYEEIISIAEMHATPWKTSKSLCRSWID